MQQPEATHVVVDGEFLPAPNDQNSSIVVGKDQQQKELK